MLQQGLKHIQSALKKLAEKRLKLTLGASPSPSLNPVKVASIQEAFHRYGAITPKLQWANETQWMSLFDVCTILGPSHAWINSATGKPLQHIYCNKDLQPALTQAIKNVVQRGLVHELKTFDGCFEIRAVRGYTTDLSTHAFGLAIDLNARTNPLGGPSTQDPQLVACFTDAGLVWGGKFSRKDPMHYSFGWER